MATHPRKTRKRPQSRPLTAATSDRHKLYEDAVQAPDAEVEFVSSAFKKLKGRPARSLREDFCGTALTACEWVKTHKDNTAIGLDLHQPTLSWGTKHNVQSLDDGAQGRIRLLRRDVRRPGDAVGVDIVLAMNFSYWIFKTREGLREYFASVHKSLAKDGVFFLDHFSGYEAQQVQEERRRCKGYTYIWDQASFNPITADYTCHIHFEFTKGPRMNKAFTYDWRLWTLPEVVEVLKEAGFRNVTVYWEGDNGHGGGNSIFKPRKVAEPEAASICYISAEK
jgi:cyclopropane fatty-acyl-phospholipid synthase-like methyltransferase